MIRSRMTNRRPGFEVLEDRNCPACLVELAGTTLQITGDGAANDISIFYFPGELSIMCDGMATSVTAPVKKVVVQAGGGNDSVYTELYPDGQDAAFPSSWTLDLGDGNDRSTHHLLGFLSVDYPLSVNVSGGDGNDTLFTETIGLLNASYVETVEGGNGNDRIFNFNSGEVYGSMSANTHGGNGNDIIFQEFTLWKVFGSFHARVDGGNGDDVIDSRLGEYILLDPELPLEVIGFTVAPGAHAEYRVAAGNGEDVLTTKYVGQLDGDLNILVNGGNGDDDFFADYEINATSTGALSSKIRGGNGDDILDVELWFFETELMEFPDIPGYFVDALTGYVDDPGLLEGLSIAVDGGNGFDTCLHSALVSLMNVEDHQVL
jgi:hypothetical protein